MENMRNFRSGYNTERDIADIRIDTTITIDSKNQTKRKNCFVHEHPCKEVTNGLTWGRRKKVRTKKIDIKKEEIKNGDNQVQNYHPSFGQTGKNATGINKIKPNILKKNRNERYFLNSPPLHGRWYNSNASVAAEENIVDLFSFRRRASEDGDPLFENHDASTKTISSKINNVTPNFPNDAENNSASDLLNRKKRNRELWRKAFVYARTVATLSTKPPKQEAKRDLKVLEEVAGSNLRRKIYTSWDKISSDIQRASRVPTTTTTNNSNTVIQSELDVKKKLPLHMWMTIIGRYINTPSGEMQKLFKKIVGDNLCISFEEFKKFIQPQSSKELSEWDRYLKQEKSREIEENELNIKRKIEYEDRIKEARVNATLKLNQAWSDSYDELMLSDGNLVKIILEREEKEKEMVQLAPKKLKAGWGEPLTETIKRALYHIMIAGTYEPEVPTSVVWKKVKQSYSDISNNNVSSDGKIVHIPIINARACMINCVAYGRGLGGLLAKEAVEVLLEYLTIRCQAAFRGSKKRKRMFRAIRMWKDKEYNLQKSAFTSWSKETRRNVDLQICCRPVFYSWKRKTKINIRKRDYFTRVFWPFYVWRRHVTLSSAKGRLLRGKLYILRHTWRLLRLLQTFRSWRETAIASVKFEDFLCRKRDRSKRLYFHLWLERTRKVLALRKLWDWKGQYMCNEKKRLLLHKCIIYWKCITFCSNKLRKNVHETFRVTTRQMFSILNQRSDITTCELKLSGQKGRRRAASVRQSHVITSVGRKNHNRRRSTVRRSTRSCKNICACVTMLKNLRCEHKILLDVKKNCADMHLRFERKIFYQNIGAYFSLQRAGPIILRDLYRNSMEQKKGKYAIQHYRIFFLRYYFLRYRNYVKRKTKQRKKRRTHRENLCGYSSDDNSSTTSLQSIRSEIPLFPYERGTINIDDFLQSDENNRAIQRNRLNDRFKRLDSFVNKHICKAAKEYCDTQIFLDDETVSKASGTSTSIANVIVSERVGTFKASQRALLYVKNLKVNSGINFMKVLNKIYEHRQLIMMRRRFKVWKLVLIESKVDCIFIRKKILRYIRLSKDIKLFLDNIHFYHHFKTKKKIFDAWFHSTYAACSVRSYGMSAKCKALRIRVGAFDSFLERHPLLSNGIERHISYERMNPITTSTRSLFLRWSSYVSAVKSRGKAYNIAKRLYEAKLLLLAFASFKGMKKKCNVHGTFLVQRLKADLELMSKCSLITQKRNLFSRLRWKNHVRKRNIMEDARNGPSFKKFLAEHEASVRERIEYEQKLLLKAFADRGKLGFHDELKKDTVASGSGVHDSDLTAVLDASRLEFRENSVTREWSCKAEQGEKISELWVNWKPGMGILGIQVMASLDGKKKIIGTHGNYFVGLKECFELDPEEQLIRVDAFCGEFIEQIRFFTSHGKISPWIGERISNDRTQVFQMRSHKKLMDPLESYIVGFFGSEQAKRLNNIGIIVRHVNNQNLFSYKWIDSNNDEVKRKNAEREFYKLCEIRTERLHISLERSLAFARHLWQNRGQEVEPLTRLSILSQLTKWYFNSIAFRLPVNSDTIRRGSIRKEGSFKYHTRATTVSSLDLTCKNTLYYTDLLNYARAKIRLAAAL